MTPVQCIGEPISWLRLERYRLSELDARVQHEVEHHLAQCAACRDCAAQVATERALPALPPRPVASAPRAARARRMRWPWLGAGALAAAAAAIALSLRVPGPGLDPPRPQRSVKGGELALGLVRMRNDSPAYDPTRFAPGDRFKLQLTCPPEMRGTVEVSVFQDGAAFFPLPAHALEQCGNLRTLPGAFSLDGDAPATVCATLMQDGTLDRARVSADGPRALPELSVCRTLMPAR